MAEIQPFQGYRYDVAQVGDLSDVTAPPYDVIDDREQNALYQRHPCNVVRLILNREEPGDGPQDRYERAANFLHRWIQEGVLIQEREEALYVYHQEFDWEGTHYVRKGFLGRLRLEEFGKGSVFPHEETMSGPKADRLALTKTCRMNLSAVFGLFPDETGSAQEPLEDAARVQTPLVATDRLGVLHRMWPVTDREAINAVRQSLRDKPIFIADGHHRYETALNYRNFLRETEGIDENARANFVMMMFVGMNDPGLAILPTHRLVSELPAISADDLRSILESHFDLEEAGEGTEGAAAAWELIEAEGSQEVLGFGTPADGKWQLARLRDASPMQTLAPDQSGAWRGLAVSVLHRMVIEHLLKQRYPEAEPACRYVHLLSEVQEGVADGSAQLACLVPPAGIAEVQAIASRFEKMPPKSTYFYPKLLSGLVFHPLS